MIHLASDQFSTGPRYDGTWTLSSAASGTLGLVYHFIDDKPIPWMYADVDGLVVDQGGPTTVTFPELSSDKTDAATAAALQAALVPVDGGVIVMYTPATDVFTVTFGAPTVLRWSDVLSTSRLVFQGGSVDSASLAVHTLSARDVDNRPALMEVEITESVTNGANTGGTFADLFIPTSDHLLPGVEITLSAAHLTLDVMWSRPNARGIPCPMLNQWDLVFVD